jgi:helicase MOV-10
MMVPAQSQDSKEKLENPAGAHRERVPVPADLVGRTVVGKIVDVVERGKTSYGFIAIDKAVRVYFPMSSYAADNGSKARRGYEVEFYCDKDDKDRVFGSSVRLTPAGKETAVQREAMIAADKAASSGGNAVTKKAKSPNNINQANQTMVSEKSTAAADATDVAVDGEKIKKRRRVRLTKPEDNKTVSLSCTSQNSAVTKSVDALLSQSIGKLKHTAVGVFSAPTTYSVYHKGALLTKAVLRTLRDNDLIHIQDPAAVNNDEAVEAGRIAIRTKESLIEDDKNGITVSHFDFGQDTVECGQTVERQIMISNASLETKTFEVIVARDFSNTFTVVDEFGDLKGRRTEIAGESEVCVTIRAFCSRACRENSFVLFDFMEFSIGRFVTIDMGSVAVAEAVRIERKYSKARRIVGSTSKGEGQVLEGESIRPATSGFTPLAEYRIPEKVKQLTDPEKSKDFVLEFLGRKDHPEFYHHLLWYEELAMNQDILQYNMEHVPVKVIGKLIRISVPGLLDSRPSVLCNDKVRVNLVGDPKRVLYIGFVRDVHRDNLDVHFHDNLVTQCSLGTPRQLNVEFTVNRSVLKRLHQASDDIMEVSDRDVLLQYEKTPYKFADEVSSDVLAPGPKMQTEFLDELNKEQGAAVLRIVSTSNRRRPYVIFGPPGTGKTTTVVASINAIRLHRPQARILVCAPSNFAADELLVRLAKRNSETEMFRFMSYNRSVTNIDPNKRSHVLPYSNHQGDHFLFPQLDKFLEYHIVVCTCAMAAILKNLHVPRGHFDVIFIDEAGHAVEPEALGAFAWNLSQRGQLVIAGDPEQLGPVVHSRTATLAGLHVSFLERLVNTPNSPYQRNPTLYSEVPTHYNSNYITKLTTCYRCHPHILHIPNKLFYEHDLVAFGDVMKCDNLLTWEQLPNKTFPILFIGVEGTEAQEASSPSWCNLSEVNQVVDVVKQLMAVDDMSVADIGIITPYYQQSQKIKKGLAATNDEYKKILVGSCEKFQGQERRAIIISTVRSTTNFEDGSKTNLGFLTNPKRFNVAITRAEALVVVIGNPYSLCQDDNWRELIQYCVEHCSCKGVPPPTFDDNDNNSSSNNSSSSSAATADRIGSAAILAAMMQRSLRVSDEQNNGNAEDAEVGASIELPLANDV